MVCVLCYLKYYFLNINNDTYILLLGNCDLSDCESFGNKTHDKNNQKQNINSSRASLISASSHPEIRSFFKVIISRHRFYHT